MPKNFNNIQRNFDNIQFGKLRKKIDPKFNNAHDKLSEAYYTYKKEGQNTFVSIGGQMIEFNNSRTLEKNKEIFDKYHALIHHLQTVALDLENKKQSLIKRDKKLHDKYNTKNKNSNMTTLEEIIDKIQKLKLENFKLNL